MASIKFKRSIKLLLKDMAGLKGTSRPKRGLIEWVPTAKGSYLGHPCMVKLYHSHHVTSKIARRLCDRIEWVHT